MSSMLNYCSLVSILTTFQLYRGGKFFCVVEAGVPLENLPLG